MPGKAGASLEATCIPPRHGIANAVLRRNPGVRESTGRTDASVRSWPGDCPRITHPKWCRPASAGVHVVFDCKKSSRKSAQLGWCAAEIKARPSLCFHACLLGSRRRGSAPDIRARQASPSPGTGVGATKAHEMRHFSKVDAYLA
jgi:hypothetical protein